MNPPCSYDPELQNKIKTLYIIAIIFWIFLIIILSLFVRDFFVILILSIPFIVFTVSYFNIKCYSRELDSEMFRTDFIFFIGILITVFTGWKEKTKHSVQMFKILMVSLILIMLSSIDIWLGRDEFTLLKHFRSIMQTLALTLLIYALYLYYLDHVFGEKDKSDERVKNLSSI